MMIAIAAVAAIRKNTTTSIQSINEERIARKKYNNAIADGLSKETAEKIRINSIANPDVATVKSAQDAMLEGTFQKELPPGFFKNIQKNINHPAAKLFIPFYRTIMNIFFESNRDFYSRKEYSLFKFIIFYYASYFA